MEASLLSGLNAAQRAAVTSTVQVLQVLAPPGSGKTKTLTSRVAHLLAHRNHDPRNVICCTFTIKASREMSERLRGLVGEQLESKLILGTFHSICRRYLVAYGTKIGIGKGFGIADTSDSKSIVKRIIKKHSLKIEPNTARSKISWNKARFRTVEVLEKEVAEAKNLNQNQQDLLTVFREYENELKNNNLLDYDDLLLRCVDLLRAHPMCVSNVEALLIDEFQDTNIVQYELMKLFASAQDHVTIVGDPDQSIYGFRSAEIENLKRMKAYYRDTVVINLEENYRSAAAVLNLAQDVIDQDTDRPDKKLKSTHCYGTLPVLRRLPNPYEEGLWIANEVKRTIAMTGSLIDHADIAVLIRSGYLSLLIEKAFTSAGIPYRMVGGMRFFDRAEIRLIVDYLRTISHPDNNAAFLAIINVPSRKIGETAIASLTKLSEEHKLPVFRVVQKVLAGKLTPGKKLSKPSEQDLQKLVNLINRARDKMEDMQPAQVPSQLVDYVVTSLSLQAYLQAKYKDDYEDRIENIQEFIAHASDVASISAGESLPTVAGVEQEQIDKCQEALDQFLANIVLSSEVEQDDKADAKPRVTISTIHSAKGLEWPVVFIPSVYEGSIPHSRAEDIDEERRLLYVAITRAQALLNISFPVMGSRDQGSLDLTPFLPQSLHHRTADRAPLFTDNVIGDIATILRRDMPSQQAIAEGAASLTIKQSPEDNLWPIDGRPALGPEQNILMGGAGLVQSMSAGIQNSFSSAGFQTTMGSVNNFSTSNTSMSMGFTTAGQQMRDTQTTSQPKGAHGKSHTQAPTASKTGIRSFFSSQTSAGNTSAAEATRQSWSSRPSQTMPNTGPPRHAPQLHWSHSQPVPEPQLPAMRSFPPKLQSPVLQIPQQLQQFGNHRLPTVNGMGRVSAPGRAIPDPTVAAGFKRARPMPLEEVSPNREKKKYHFLSSSPTQELFDKDGELTLGTREDFDEDKPVQQPQPLRKGAAAQSDGVDFSSRPAPPGVVERPAVGPKKKSLGVRGAFVPWNERKHK